MGNSKGQSYYKIIGLFPDSMIPKFIFLGEEQAETVTEIRLRSNRKAVLSTCGGNFYISGSSCLTKDRSAGIETSEEEIKSLFASLCNYSVYNRQEDIKNGFITLDGGHRAGVCGTAVFKDGRITNIDNISSVVLRVAREHKECARELLKRISYDIDGVLICGEPSSGKTTLIRDIARIISVEKEKNVVIADTKNEISATKNSVPQNDIGNSDALVSFSKEKAISHAVRNLSPDIVICDEIGGAEEAEEIKNGVNCGVGFLFTIHAKDPPELKKRPVFRLLAESGAVKKAVFLSSRKKRGRIKEILNTEELL